MRAGKMQYTFDPKLMHYRLYLTLVKNSTTGTWEHSGCDVGAIYRDPVLFDEQQAIKTMRMWVAKKNISMAPEIKCIEFLKVETTDIEDIQKAFVYHEYFKYPALQQKILTDNPTIAPLIRFLWNLCDKVVKLEFGADISDPTNVINYGNYEITAILGHDIPYQRGVEYTVGGDK